MLGIEPTGAAKIAIERGIHTHVAFFNRTAAEHAVRECGNAKLITATNVFAHIEDVHEIVEWILLMLKDDGIFISESHYLIPLLETVQYDTIYHEHLRYYSLTSLKYLLEMHGLQIIHARRIPTHGGSIRVYAARKGQYEPRTSVAADPRPRGGITCAGPVRIFSKTRHRFEARSLVALARHQVSRPAHLRHRRSVAREHARELLRPGRWRPSLRLRDRRVAQDWQVHAGHAR